VQIESGFRQNINMMRSKTAAIRQAFAQSTSQVLEYQHSFYSLRSITNDVLYR